MSVSCNTIPLTLLVGAVTSFNTLIVLAIWLDATITFLCLRSFTSNKWTAWVGGLLFGFSPFVYAELNSGQLPWLSLFLLPVSLVLIVRLFVIRPSRPWLLGLEIGWRATARGFESHPLRQYKQVVRLFGPAPFLCQVEFAA